MKGELGGGAAVTACSVSLIGGDRSLPLPFPGSPQKDHPAFTSTCGKAAPRRVVFPQRSRTRRCDRAPASGRNTPQRPKSKLTPLGEPVSSSSAYVVMADQTRRPVGEGRPSTWSPD